MRTDVELVFQTVKGMLETAPNRNGKPGVPAELATATKDN